MTSDRFHFRLRWRDAGVSQSLRFRNERQVRAFLQTLQEQRPDVQVIVERRAATIGPWEPIVIGKDGAR